MFILSYLPAREIELESLDNLGNKSSFANSRLDEYTLGTRGLIFLACSCGRMFQPEVAARKATSSLPLSETRETRK